MALLGRNEAYYNTYLGPFPEKAIIINVAAGVSHFPRAQIAIDPIYDEPISAIRNEGQDAINSLEQRLGNGISDAEAEYIQMLANSLKAFTETYLINGVQYIAAALPWIPVNPPKVDLVLCSHFIFTYNLGLYGTMACIANLMDLAHEGRIYPYCVDQLRAIAHFMPHLNFEPTATYLKITHNEQY
jgi:hypothetical protein